jgi:cation:H+ antiporter
MQFLTPWLLLAACAAAIWIAGVRLLRYGDAIARHTGASRTWIGVILLASITSLPEMTTGVSAVGLANAPDIAIGDVLGSCVFNLFILTIVDFLHRGEPFYSRAREGHILTASFGVVLIGITGFVILLSRIDPGWTIGYVGISTPLIIVLYLVAVRTIYQYERAHPAPADDEPFGDVAEIPLGQALRRYAAWGLIVVAAGAGLPFIGQMIAGVMNWELTFVGTLLIAAATSLPEVVVTIAAVRSGALSMAIGNLFGSNLFNILILAIDDLVYRQGPLLAHGSAAHAVSAISGVTMTGVALVGMLYRPRVRLFKLVGWVSLALFSLYLLNAYVLYLFRA